MKSTRCALLTGVLAAALAAGCSKAGDSQGDETTVAPRPAAAGEPGVAKTATAPADPVAPAPGAEEPAPGAGAEPGDGADLEAAIAGAKKGDTVTAIGAEGQARVHALGQKTIADTDTYSVRVELPDAAAKGAASAVALHVSPKPGWKLNLEFPTKLTVAPPAGVEVDKPTQKVADAATFAEQGAVFQIGFTAADPGSKQFTADFKFAVCTESTCDPKKQELAWAVDVK